jgi:hypothetical protein
MKQCKGHRSIRHGEDKVMPPFTEQGRKNFDQAFRKKEEKKS